MSELLNLAPWTDSEFENFHLLLSRFSFGFVPEPYVNPQSTKPQTFIAGLAFWVRARACCAGGP